MEMLLHFIWKHRLAGNRFVTINGGEVEVLSPGIHNEASGPDFSYARIRHAGTHWAGNVEIHVRASDWHRHGHQADPAYQNVILHAVAHSDTLIQRNDGTVIPQVTLQLPDGYPSSYEALMEQIRAVQCQRQLSGIPQLVKTDWIETLAVERLQSKASRMLADCSQLGGDWEQTMFVALARSLGFGLNGLPFEMLAKSLPLKVIWHHSDNPFQIRALLLGQAGLINRFAAKDANAASALTAEYSFLRAKYGLEPLPDGMWKYAGLRPPNFPHKRIELLVALYTRGLRLTSQLLDCNGNPEALAEAFGINHSNKKAIGDAAVQSLMINVAAPFYFAYGQATGNAELAEKAIDLLCRLPREANAIISQWAKGGIKATDALQSQALLHLRVAYCDMCKCGECRFGHWLLRHHRKSEQQTASEYLAEPSIAPI